MEEEVQILLLLNAQINRIKFRSFLSMICWTNHNVQLCYRNFLVEESMWVFTNGHQ